MKIFVKVNPKARQEKIIKISDTNFKIWVKEPPEKGRANQAVIAALGDYFNTSPANINKFDSVRRPRRVEIKIISGSNSKLKIIEIVKK